MSSEKTSTEVTPGGRPTWSEKIVLLRRDLTLTQIQLAKELDVQQAAVSSWETGLKKPAPAHLIAMAEMTEDRDLRAFFHKMAEQLAGVKIAGMAQPTGPHTQGRSTMVYIPLLKDSAAAGTPRALDEKNIEKQLEVPAWMCPRPKGCVAIRVSGDSMSPILEDGYIVLVDTTDRDPKKLVNEMVAARDSEGGVTFKWLRKMKHSYVLMPNHTSLRHEPMPIESDDDFAIVGRIVHFIGQPPRPRGKK